MYEPQVTSETKERVRMRWEVQNAIARAWGDTAMVPSLDRVVRLLRELDVDVEGEPRGNPVPEPPLRDLGHQAEREPVGDDVEAILERADLPSWISHVSTTRKIVAAAAAYYRSRLSAHPERPPVTSEAVEAIVAMHGALTRVWGILNRYAQREDMEGVSPIEPQGVIGQIYGDLAAHWRGFDSAIAGLTIDPEPSEEGREAAGAGD